MLSALWNRLLFELTNVSNSPNKKLIKKLDFSGGFKV